jgi:hypothetical protein
MTHCLIVRAYGKELDRLRAEAHRITRQSKTDWWAEAKEKGTAFCFEAAGAKDLFIKFCDKENVQCTQDL